MIEFNKSDIKALDYILERCLDSNASSATTINDLKDAGLLKNKESHKTLITPDDVIEFERLMFIIRQYDCAETRFISEKLDDEISNVTANIKTAQFKELGGFRNAYKKLKKPIDWYKFVPIILTIIFGIATVYFAKVNYELKVKQEEFNGKIENGKANVLTKKNISGTLN